MSLARLATVGALVLTLVGCLSGSSLDSVDGGFDQLEGTLLFEKLDGSKTDIVRLDFASGRLQQISQTGRAPGAVAARESPDGSAVVYAQFIESTGRIGLVRDTRNGGSPRIISDATADDVLPAWSPDCQGIFFARFAGNNAPGSIWRMGADGSNREIHFASSEFSTGPDQSLHHERLLFHSAHDPDVPGTAIHVIEIGPGTPSRVTPVDVNAAWGRWSPVADEIVFEEISNDGLGTRVSVIGGDGTGLRSITSFEEGFRRPVWSPDGQWIAYRDSQGQLVAASVDGEANVELGIDGVANDWGPHDGTCPASTGAIPQP